MVVKAGINVNESAVSKSTIGVMLMPHQMQSLFVKQMPVLTAKFSSHGKLSVS